MNESDREEGERDDEDAVQHKCPYYDFGFLGLGARYQSVNWFDKGHISEDDVWAIDSHDGVLLVKEGSLICSEDLVFVTQRNILSSAKVVVQNFEGGEGMKHFLAISSDLFGAQGIPREEVVDVTNIIGWKSTVSILLRRLRSSSMSKDTRSTVSSREELFWLGVKVLLLGVMSVVGTVIADNTPAAGTDLAWRARYTILLLDLHVDHVQSHDLSFSVSGILIGGRLRWSLHPCVDLIDGKVSIVASEGKIFKWSLAGEDLPVTVGVRNSIYSG